jgi:membrane protease YdiL (CAAX protease family)
VREHEDEPVRLGVARHPIVAFLLIGNGVYLAAALIPPLVEAKVLPFDLPLFAALGTILGVGLAAFVVTGAADGWSGARDLARRTLRWRVPVRWYLITLFGVPVAATLVAIAVYGGEMLDPPPEGWARGLAAFAAFFVLQLILFQFAEEIGWTGFLQHRLQDRFGAVKLSALVALPWAVWHLPDFFAEEGWTVATLTVAPLFLLFEFVSLFFARVLIVWLYDRTGQSILLVAVFHASFNATISKLAIDTFPGSNAARFAILMGVIVVAATSVIVATKGRVEATVPHGTV